MKTLLAATIGVFLAFVAPARAQQASYVVIGQNLEMQSQVLEEQRPYTVYLPASYEASASASQRYPVIYLLDGGAHDAATYGIVHHLSAYSSAVLRMPESIIVAIPNTMRTRDLTPSSVATGLYSKNSGGADNFMRFLDEELIPLIEQRYRTTSERTLIGHSLGGLFALHVLDRKPELFSHYIAVDPSLWWDDDLLVRRVARQMNSKLTQRVSVYIARAKSSTAPGTDRAFNARHDKAIERYAELLARNRNDLRRTQYAFYELETHLSIPLIAIYRGLLFGHEGFKPAVTTPAK